MQSITFSCEMSGKTQKGLNSKSTWMGSLVLLPLASFIVFESQYLFQYYDPKNTDNKKFTRLLRFRELFKMCYVTLHLARCDLFLHRHGDRHIRLMANHKLKSLTLIFAFL